MTTEETLLEYMQELAYKPMTYKELEEHFGVEDAESFKAFVKLLNRLEQEGKIVRTRTNRYGIPERMNLVLGKLQAHPKGFAFLIPEDDDHQDVYIHANDFKGAMNGDTVLVRITSKSYGNGKLEGEVARIVARANTEVVGTFESYESYGFVIPDDKRLFKDILIPKDKFNDAVTGQKVVVQLVTYPDSRKASAEGEIIEILGHKDDPGVDILSIIRKHKLPEGFNPEVMAEAEQVPDTVREEDLVGRRDLRELTIFTIDGEDAKDLDDAVHVELLPNGHYKLGVHIADVNHYVKENSEIDRDAYLRGCSVYLVDRVIPMLPRRLSNGICSLNPQVDRLTLSCEMEFDPTGRLVAHDIFPSVIRTTERMTYTNVRKILIDQDPEVMARYSEWVEDFQLMEQLALILRERRMERGAVDFDFPESKVLVDEEGKPLEIVKQERTIAEQIIEEFMLAANETVAEHFHWLKVPFLYRIHEDPDQEKMMRFIEFIANFGYVVRGKGNKVHPRALQSLLDEIEGTREETVISTMMLRSMKQARYDAESLGHFGLASEFYTHFTSPIRRYPDLVIHRVIKEVLTLGSLSSGRAEYLAERMPDIAKQSSERERIAVEAERETDALKKAEYMLDKIGEEYEGMISSVTSFGMFVELENTVEGLIRLSDMSDDYYHFDEIHMVLIGQRTSKVYRIGDEVRVRVVRVNLDERNIDFELVDMKPRKGRMSLVDGADQGIGFGKGKGVKARRSANARGGGGSANGKSRGRRNGAKGGKRDGGDNGGKPSGKGSKGSGKSNRKSKGGKGKKR